MVMPIRDPKLDGAAGAATAVGLRPPTASAPAAAAPELSDRPRRRTFTAQDKLRILAEIDRAPAGGTGAILRREGLYSSGLSQRRRLRETGALGAKTSVKRGPKPAVRNPMAAELAQAKKGECPVDAPAGACRGHHRHPKKVAALLGLPLATSDSDEAS
jgi:transposase